MTAVELDPALRAELTGLLDAREAVFAVEVDPDLPAAEFHAESDRRRLEELLLTEQLMLRYGTATGRCAGQLRYFGLDARDPCLRPASRPSGLCGTHDNQWDGQVERARLRVASNERLAYAGTVAAMLRTHGLDATAGTDHIAIPVADAVELDEVLTRAAGAGLFAGFGGGRS